MTFIKKSKNRGFGLVEIIVALAIITSALLAIAGVSRLAFAVSQQSVLRLQAGFLLEEGIEALKSIRDRSWDDFSAIPTATTSYLVFLGGVWESTSTEPALISGIFRRSAELQNVLRDANDNIAASGEPDADSRKVIVRVLWKERGSDVSKEVISYINKIFD